jgi:hypothetical protein
MAYGSGCAASIYGLEATVAPAHTVDVLTHLTMRQPLPIEDSLIFVHAFEVTHGRFGFTPSKAGYQKFAAYFLHSVSAMGI